MTHAVDFLHLVDSIILMKNGKVVFKGPYQEVKDNDYLKELVRIHRSHNAETGQNDLDIADVPKIDIIDDKDDESDEEIKEALLPDTSDEEKSTDEEPDVEEVDDDPNIRERSGRKKKKNVYSVNISDQTDNDKKLSGQITTDENKEENRVTFEVYKAYTNYCGGWKQVLAVNIAMCGFIGFKVTSDYMIGSWAEISEDPDHNDFAFFCGLYFFFTVGSSFFIWCRVIILMYYSWHGMRKLHEDMIDRVLNAPINLYFDTTPIGRILNRFSKDLSGIEMWMVYIIGTFYVYLYNLLSIIALSVAVIPWIIFLFPVIAILCWWLFRYTVAGTKEANRVSSVTSSPIVQYLQETISGASTIRAFEKRD